MDFSHGSLSLAGESIAQDSQRCGTMPQQAVRRRSWFRSTLIVKSTKLFRCIPNKREFLARALGRMGVLGLLERAAATWRPALVVLTYHRIAESHADQFYDPVISATPESFRAQVEWLHNRFRLLTLHELVAQVQSGIPWRGPMVLLTFDDGYRDNFDVAGPILRELNIPATFFIPTAFLESPRLPWWDHVAYVIKQTQMRRFTLERNASDGAPPPLVIDLETMPRAAAIMTIVRAFLDETIADERWFLDQLSSRAKVNVDREGLGRVLFMTWDHVRAACRLERGPDDRLARAQPSQAGRARR